MTVENVSLQEMFNKSKERLRAKFTQSGADKAVTRISAAIHDMQSIGIDVQLDLHYMQQSPVDMAYTEFVQRCLYDAYVETLVAGKLFIGTETYHVILSVKEKTDDVLNFYITKDLSRHYERECINFKRDDAEKILQNYVISVAAPQVIVGEYDPHKAFGPRDAAGAAPKSFLEKKKL